MKIIIQRVTEASVVVEGKTVGEIGGGLLAFLGIHREDSSKKIIPLADRLLNFRMFRDDADKMNLSLLDVGGGLLVVSQFTLYANCKSGRRPSFTDAAPPDLAKDLYEEFVAYSKTKLEKVETGVFAAYMQVHLINDGPVTFTLED